MDEIQPLQHQDTQIDGTGAAPASEKGPMAKRQRRPSVRLGEIGDQPAATLFNESHRRPKHWKPSPACKDQAGKSSRTRPLAKLGAGSFHQDDETLDSHSLEEDESRDFDFDNLAIGSWRTKDSKSKRVCKKPRTNWLPKIEEGGGSARSRNAEEDNKSAPGEDDEMDETQGLGLESPLKEQLGLGGSQLRRSHHSSSRVRVEEERDLYGNGVDEAHLDGPLETDRSEDGVKSWLEGLGLGRYWAVFEIHEVDEEVLPLLTLEDLKDMGINAVGSRRKMFGSIQKLRKGFS